MEEGDPCATFDWPESNGPATDPRSMAKASAATVLMHASAWLFAKNNGVLSTEGTADPGFLVPSYS